MAAFKTPFSQLSFNPGKLEPKKNKSKGLGVSSLRVLVTVQLWRESSCFYSKFLKNVQIHAIHINSIKCLHYGV